MKNILVLARKEWQTYFNNPSAYIIIGAFLLLWEFLFFRTVFLVGEVSLRSFFDILPWISLVVVPALTMGSISEERSDGTLEFLLTRPIRIFELVIGKFLGVFGIFFVATLFVFPLAWSFGKFGNLDWGQTVTQYLAALFLGSLFTSLGIFISSIFSHQILAFVVSALVGFFFVISGTDIVTARLPFGVIPFFEQLSATSHFDSLSRGVIDLRDIWYFVSFSIIFLVCASVLLLRGKYGRKSVALRRFHLAFFFLLGIVVLSNIVGSRIPGRIDLTQEKVYTLSPVTKSLIGSLPDDIVNITLYSSDKLPAQLQPVLRETQDILRDYATISHGKIQFSLKNPSSSSDVASEAESLGIQSVRFNVVSQEEFQVKDGYLGIVVAYGGKHESIPFIQSTSGLEYQVSSFLKQLTTDKKPKIGFVVGHGEKSLSQDYRTVSSEWRKQFDIQEIQGVSENAGSPDRNLPGRAGSAGVPAPITTLSIPSDIGTIVVAGPKEVYSEEERKSLSDFIGRGGNVLFLIDGVSVAPQSMVALPNENSFSDFVQEQTGVNVKQNLVYDLRSNESVNFGGGRMHYILPYPLWVRAVRAQTISPIVSRIESLTFPWTSALDVDGKTIDEKGFHKDDLFVTTDSAGSLESNSSLAPDQKWPQDSLGRMVLAVALSPKDSNGAKKSRMVIVGNSGFLTEQFMENNPSNLSFALEALSWLSQESSLSSILSKSSPNRRFLFQSPSEPNLLKFGNMGLVLLAMVGYGSMRLYRRNRKKYDPYFGSEGT